jgi:hypothetical protein
MSGLRQDFLFPFAEEIFVGWQSLCGHVFILSVYWKGTVFSELSRVL